MGFVIRHFTKLHHLDENWQVYEDDLGFKEDRTVNLDARGRSTFDTKRRNWMTSTNRLDSRYHPNCEDRVSSSRH